MLRRYHTRPYKEYPKLFHSFVSLILFSIILNIQLYEPFGHQIDKEAEPHK